MRKRIASLQQGLGKVPSLAWHAHGERAEQPCPDRGGRCLARQRPGARAGAGGIRRHVVFERRAGARGAAPRRYDGRRHAHSHRRRRQHIGQRPYAHPAGRGLRRGSDAARRAGSAGRGPRALRPRDPRRRSSRHRRLRGAAPAARGRATHAGAGAYRARHGRRPRARAGPRRRRLHGQALRHAGAGGARARADPALAGAERPPRRARAA